MKPFFFNKDFDVSGGDKGGFQEVYQTISALHTSLNRRPTTYYVMVTIIHSVLFLSNPMRYTEGEDSSVIK